MSNDQIQAATGIPTWQERAYDELGDNWRGYKTDSFMQAEIDDLRAQLARQGQGMYAAADFIDKRAEQYLNENASSEHDTGATVFHYGAAGRDYYNTLTELADDLRNAAPASAQPADMAEVRRCAFAEIGEKLRANIPPDELARFVDAEILRPRAQPDRGAAPGGHWEPLGEFAQRWVPDTAPHSQPVRGVPDDQLRQILQEFVDYHTKPAGLTLETALDRECFGVFLEGIEAREKDMVTRAKAMLAALPQGLQVGGQTCAWTEHPEDGYWNTSCGHAWTIIDGTPTDNNMAFCHGCGKRLVQASSTAPEGADGIGGAA